MTSRSESGPEAPHAAGAEEPGQRAVTLFLQADDEADPRAARALLLEGLALIECRGGPSSLDADLRRNVLLAHSRLADLALAAGDFEEGVGEAEVTVRLDPDCRWPRDLLRRAAQALGDALLASDRPREARERYQQALGAAEWLAAGAPEDQETVAECWLRLSDVARWEEDAIAARGAVARALLALGPEAGNGSPVRRQGLLAQAYARQGWAADADGDLEGARIARERALDLFRGLASATPDRVRPWHRVAHALANLGDLARRQGDLARARRHLDEGVALLVDGPGRTTGIDEPRYPDHLAELADLATALGDHAGAARCRHAALERPAGPEPGC